MMEQKVKFVKWRGKIVINLDFCETVDKEVKKCKYELEAVKIAVSSRNIWKKT